MEPYNKELTIDHILEHIEKEVENRNRYKSSGILDFEDFFVEKHHAAKDKIEEYHSIDDFRLLRKIQRLLIRLSIYKLFKPFVTIFKKVFPVSQRKGPRLSSLLEYEDKLFVIHAYKAILGRFPDENGLISNLENMRKHHQGKIELLMTLHNSQEGKAKNLPLYGLKLRYAIYKISSFIKKIPVVGYLVSIIASIIYLPMMIKKTKRREYALYANITHDMQELYSRVQKENNILYNKFEDINDTISNIPKSIEYIQHQFDSLKQSIESVKAQINSIEKEFDIKTSDILEQSESKLAEFSHKHFKDIEFLTNDTALKINDIKDTTLELASQVKDHELNIHDQQRKISVLLDAIRNGFPEKQNECIKTITSEEDHFLDSLYVSFEDSFRGTREDIKERLRVYLPYFENVNISRSASIIDIGCGRGEWIELLNENGYTAAKGIDMNRVMVHECKELGLDAEEYDAIAYLREQYANSIDVITGFHIVEHITLKELINLFDECLRVLKPNGIVIFETPNPENIIVATCTFYIDPTHIKPIHPQTLNFLLEARGFSKLEILKLHPLNYFEYELKKDDPLSHIAYRYNMEQDYSIMAVKS